jgi:glycosyltransferase involved in cell wall biosynthesis
VRSLFISPIEPLSTGNGLAMRAGVWLEALGRLGSVDLAVLPLAGDIAPTAWADDRCHRRWTLRVEAADAVATVADSHWRAQLAALDPRPAIATDAWPGTGVRLAEQVCESGPLPDVVVGLRSYMGPVAAGAALRLDARLVVDLDDDDLAVAVPGEADAWDRLVGRVGEWAGQLTIASSDDAMVVAERLDRAVTVLPNVVRPVTSSPIRADIDVLRLLFVGNLTYEPNRDAANELVESIVPLCGDAHLTIVGAAAHEDRRAWNDHERVDHLGWVEDLEPIYRAVDAVIVPIRSGSGTRIKVLEAMAHGRPVVATPTAVAGLGLEPGRHALIADSVEDLVAAVQSLRDRGLAAPMVEAAARFVRERHHPDRAFEIVGSLLGAN